jgi:hypothetical protein
MTEDFAEFKYNVRAQSKQLTECQIYLIRRNIGQAQWFIPVVPVTREAEIGSIVVGVQPRQKVSETPPSHKKLKLSGLPQLRTCKILGKINKFELL